MIMIINIYTVFLRKIVIENLDIFTIEKHIQDIVKSNTE